MGPPSQLCRRADSLGDVESDRFVARGDERFGIAGANAAGVGDMPISWNGFGPDVALLFLLDAPFLTAFSPKKRCPFQLVPVTPWRPAKGCGRRSRSRRTRRRGS